MSVIFQVRSLLFWLSTKIPVVVIIIHSTQRRFAGASKRLDEGAYAQRGAHFAGTIAGWSP